MAGIDEVLERLVTDVGFRTQLQQDPRSALEGYVLYDEDLEVLAATLDEGERAEHGVEQRTSKSALLGAFLFGDLGGGRSGGSSGHLAPPGSEPSHDIGSPYLKKACFDNTFDDTGVSMGGLVTNDGLDAPMVVGSDAEAPDRPLIVGRMPNPTIEPGPEATDPPPSEELVAPQDGGDASMTKSQLTTPLARPSSENPAPIDDLAADDGAEEAEITYPGVYVQEVPSPEAPQTDPPDLVAEQQAVEDGGVAALAAPEPPAGGHAAGAAGLRSDGELVQASATPEGPLGETDLDATSPPDRGGESEQTAADPTLIGKITPKPLTDEPDAPPEALGNEVAIETLAVQNEGVDAESDVSVGGVETETIGADRGSTVKGSKSNEN